MISSNSSENTAVIFMYLPLPPEPVDNYTNPESLQSNFGCENIRLNPDGLPDLQEYERKLSQECPERVQYMNVLKGFTEDLPPTVLVHGLKAVTSTLL